MCPVCQLRPVSRVAELDMTEMIEHDVPLKILHWLAEL